MMWSSNISFSPAAESPGVQRLDVAKASSPVTRGERDTCECKSWIQVLRSLNNPGVTGSCSLISSQKSKLEFITRSSYSYFHFCLYHNIQMSSRYTSAVLALIGKESFSEQKWKQLLCNGSELPWNMSRENAMCLLPTKSLWGFKFQSKGFTLQKLLLT